MKGSANAGKMDSETAAMLVNTVRMLDARLQNLETPKTDGVIWGASKDEQNRIYNLEQKLKVLQDEVTAVKMQIPGLDHLFQKVEELDGLVQHIRSDAETEKPGYDHLFEKVQELDGLVQQVKSDVETEKRNDMYSKSLMIQLDYSNKYFKSSLNEIERGFKEMKMRMDHIEDEFNNVDWNDNEHHQQPAPAETSPGVPYTPPPDLPPLPNMAPTRVTRRLRASLPASAQKSRK